MRPIMRSWTKAVLGTGLVALAVGGGILGINYQQLQRPMNEIIDGDRRNAGIEVSVHYKNYVPGGTLVYDFQRPGPNSSPADVFRVFLQFADAMKDASFDDVELAFRGETKFVLSGSHFKIAGREYRTENPVYTVRTFPEKLRRPDGKPAFEQWSGGLIGVASEQMNDFNRFTDEWYRSAP